MLGGNVNEIKGFLKKARFKIGDLFFPLVGPLFRVRENRKPEVKKHLHQALVSLEENKTAAALLHLNMVLSLKPNHFLARVHRGRIYLQDNRYRLASSDYVEANRISHYRFLHYHLRQEYFASVEKEFGELGASIAQNYDQIFEGLRFTHGDLVEKKETGKGREALDAYLDYENSETEMILNKGLDLDDEETRKFKEMGPITKKEIEKTDWSKVIKELIS